MTFLVFLLTLGASLRLTRLAVHDTITKPFRDFLESRESAHLLAKALALPDTAEHHRHPPWTFLRQLFDCPWCIGFWISLALSAVELHVQPIHEGPFWWTLPALTLSMSWLVGVLYTIAYTLDIYEPPTAPRTQPVSRQG